MLVKSTCFLICVCFFWIIGRGQSLVSTWSSTRPHCSNLNSGFIALYAKDGVAPYNFQIVNGGNTQNNSTGSFFGLPAGTYAATVTDATGTQVNLSTVVVYPNNHLTIDPVDTSICANANLDLVVSGLAITTYFWSSSPPDPLLINNQNDTVNVSPSLTTNYTAATNDINFNLISNGNFEAGNQGFGSAFNYLNPNNPMAISGAYGISPNASFWSSSYSPCVDHTLSNGVGKMLVVNGSDNLNAEVWRQTIAVEPGKNYDFDYWAQNLNASNPAILMIEINGVFMSQDTLNNMPCLWDLFESNWNSGLDSTATISITQIASGPSTDFALDDLSFSTLRSCTQDVLVTVLSGQQELGLQYPSNVCMNEGAVNPTLGNNIPSNGSFSSSPGGLNLNPINGQISGLGSGAGTYAVVYSVAICNILMKDTTYVTVRSVPNLLSLTGGQFDCLTQSFDSVLLYVTYTGSIDVVYTLNGTTQNINSNVSPVYLGNDLGLYSLDSISDQYCEQDLSGTITVDSLSAPWTPNISGDLTICANEPSSSISVTNANPNGDINWYSDSSLTQMIDVGSIFYPQNDSSSTYFVAQSVNGCLGDYLSFSITVESCDFIIPTAFTPDNDGQNDVWNIVGIDGKYPLNQVSIFNRWGDLIFQSKEGEYGVAPWDGTLNGQILPVGSYYYIIDLAIDQSINPVNGIISILRRP